jgi:hypothetical protein
MIKKLAGSPFFVSLSALSSMRAVRAADESGHVRGAGGGHTT